MHAPHNRARGEVLLPINGQPHKLCLTLGALAELEAAFEVVSLSELAARLACMTASDLLLVLAALTAGGGAPLSPAELSAARIEPRAAVDAVGRAFQAAFDET